MFICRGNNDADLRKLIGLLCENDYRSAGLSTKGITWGGHQDARDDGLDVVVRSDIPPPQNSFIPRNTTGLQVKKSDMPRAEILKEMKPNGVIRDEIKTLIQEKGAYIIVSSSGSTTNAALKNRIAAMKEAIADDANNQHLIVDFYDRGRIATWLRSYPSLMLWVRNKIGRPLKGWLPYGNWSNAPGGIEEEFLFDKGFRLHDGTKSRSEDLSVEDGLKILRQTLVIPGVSVRLVGLSGVGKTHLVQALFDERIGERPLNQSQVLYTDMSFGPEPDPCSFVEQLIAEKVRSILVVDNCSPDLHRRLMEKCSVSQGMIRLLTVEYDVHDDLPEETRVFKLEPASEEIIEKLIRKRFPHVSQVDARTISTESGGNARVGIALANTVQQGETLSAFRDDALFERLFRQRHATDDNLLTSAEVCSLVYSFEGKNVDSEKSELKFLSSLVGKSASELYRHVSDLKERDLIQSRDVWRAVLPHAIANRLAKRALVRIPKDILVQAFLYSDSERLIKSFTHRLSHLHDCIPAVEIVNEWLMPDGWIGKAISNLNSFGMAVFNNIAPVSQEKALEAIERAANGEDGNRFTSRENEHYYDFVQLLRHFAYEPELFDRSVQLIVRFALSETQDDKNNSVRDVLKSLFYIYLSGTHASVDARAKIIEDLVDSTDQSEQDLGLFLLDAALETWHFSSHYEFGFGARPRDYGYEPRTRDEIVHWFETFLGVSTRLALSDRPISQKARKILSDNLRGLWTKVGLYDSLENAAKRIHEKQAWNEGWIAVRGIIRYDSKGFNAEIIRRIRGLENILKPCDLLERARSYALLSQYHTFDLGDDFDDGEDPSAAWDRAEEITREIGVQVAKDTATLNTLLPALVSSDGTRLWSFGSGLAIGCNDKQALWQNLYDEIKRIPAEERRIGVLLGFLSRCAEIDPVFFNSTLDNLIEDDVLGEWFPNFQAISIIDQRSIERLHKAIDIGRANIRSFEHLAYGYAHKSVSDDDLAGLLKNILSKKEGIFVVIKILLMRFHGSKGKTTDYSENLLAVARNVLSTYPFPGEHGRHDPHDHELGRIARVCLKGKEGIKAATEICQHLAEAMIDNRIYDFDL